GGRLHAHTIDRAGAQEKIVSGIDEHLNRALDISFRKAFAGRQDEHPCDVNSSTTTGRSPAKAIAGTKPRTRPTKTKTRSAIAILRDCVSRSLSLGGVPSLRFALTRNVER